MKDRRKRGPPRPWTIVFFWCSVALVFFFGFSFSTFRLLFTGYHPRLVSSWRTSAAEAVSGETTVAPVISVGESVLFPDQVVVLLKYPPSTPLLTKDDIDCAYYSANTSRTHLKTSPFSIGGEYLDHQIVRCPVPPRGTTASVSLKTHGGDLPPGPGPTHNWQRLAYEAMIDRDNTTVVFVKGLNLRQGRPSNASRFQCVYGWDFSSRKFLLRSEAVSAAQEIVRCKTPLSILNGPQKLEVEGNSIKVSVRIIGKKALNSIARPVRRTTPDPSDVKQHRLCICTMIRNQARFMREWVMYHSRIGVEHWFIYDNNSSDDIENVIDSLVDEGFKVTRHVWPWIKTQEAGFAHCALRARDSCEWVGFIDVDEFIHLPSSVSLNSILTTTSPEVAELRTSCHNFGPSGLVEIPKRGVTVGYSCRLSRPERHKSIIRPEGLDPTLINMVHHFWLKEGATYVNMDTSVMVINHYKYQVWQVFKEKFYRRVATYIADWQEDENLGSKDRAPGLGTRAVEPADWSTRFCEVRDAGLRDWVLKTFSDPKTGMLPWEEEESRRNL